MVNKSKNKSKKKVVYSSDSEELYNSEDDYVSESETASEPESETASDIDSDSDSESDAESETQSGGEESSEAYNSETEERDEESDNASSEIEEEEEEEEAEDEVEIEEADEIENEGDDGAGDDAYVGESKVCYAKNLDKDILVLDEDDSNMYGQMEYKKIADADRISDENLTYYEMVRIIGTRAQQFNSGAPPLCKNLDQMHPAKMAYVELTLKMTPYIIRRHLPGKKYEEWRIDELEQIHEISDDFFVPENINWDLLMKEAAKINKQSGTKIIKK